MMRKNTPILPAKQDPPQFTDHSDTKINEIDWSYYQKISKLSDRKRKPVNRYEPDSNTPQKKIKVVHKATLTPLRAAKYKPSPAAKRKKKQGTQSAPSSKKVLAKNSKLPKKVIEPIKTVPKAPTKVRTLPSPVEAHCVTTVEQKLCKNCLK